LQYAIALWEMTLKDKFSAFDHWVKFVKEVHKKPVSKDTWQLLYEFSKTDLSKYNDSGAFSTPFIVALRSCGPCLHLEAWPVLIDEFVEHLRQDGVIPK